ncbi:MAG: hypothetical protein R3D65_15075 [Zhengella sp.]|uniref:hypothetical protein n=1 Tax=Zhengella sp. TaxID=2282762 RepID=UPI001DD4AEC4|nr:hypothetical protein [Notoacmeibacter sp.]MCC0026632.1 hypothetical protein [Brucellaceae bacterium]
MRSLRSGIAAAVMLALAAGSTVPAVQAQGVDATTETDAATVLAQVPLTGDVVVRFLESWQDVAALFTELDEQYEPGDPDVVMDELVYLAENAQAVARIEDRVRAAGWPGFQDWFLTAWSIMLARQWIIDPPDSDDMDAAEAEIRVMQDVTEEVRAELLASLADARNQIDSLRPSKANLAAVRMHLERLDRVLASQ